MHELSIAVSMVDEITNATEEARRNSAFAVKAVCLSLGMLSGVDSQALRFCYQAACDGTFLEGSELKIEEIPIVVHCAACSLDTRPASIQQLACSRCSAAGQVVQGHEMEITALEVAG
jgi:hydrogenase nickel incorporation protein HypA/HybF